MISIIAILFTVCAALYAALNIVSAAYCALISLSPAACAAGTEQADRFSRIRATGRVIAPPISSDYLFLYGGKEKGVCKMATILLKRFADETEWNSYWDKLFFATKQRVAVTFEITGVTNSSNNF